MSKQSHIDRTAHEPRDTSLHTVTISCITQVSPTARLFQFEISPNDSIEFLPGQWVDLYPPPHTGIRKPGGFTITSSPSLAKTRPPSQPTSPPPPLNHPSSVSNPHVHVQHAYIELAIQSSPHNPPAAYLFQPAPQLLHTQVQVRVGGSFVFPPPLPLPTTTTATTTTTNRSNDPTASPPLRKVVLVAGGMGINPLVSMLSWIGEQSHSHPQEQQQEEESGLEVRVLYSVKDPGLDSRSPLDARGGGGDGGGDDDDGGGGGGGGGGVGPGARYAGRILFLERIAQLFASGKVRGGLELFLTGGETLSSEAAGDGGKGMVRCHDGVEVPFSRRRMDVRDVEDAIGDDKDTTAVYVCGVPGMTDEFVDKLLSPEGLGMDKARVLFEKWW